MWERDLPRAQALGSEEKRSPGTRLERRPETGRFGRGKEIIGSCLPDGTTHGVLDSASSVLQKKGYQIIKSWRC